VTRILRFVKDGKPVRWSPVETASYVKDTQAARDLDADAKKLEKEAKQVTAYVIGIVVLSIAVLWGVMR
jgi:hypothetical protein